MVVVVVVLVVVVVVVVVLLLVVAVAVVAPFVLWIMTPLRTGLPLIWRCCARFLPGHHPVIRCPNCLDQLRLAADQLRTQRLHQEKTPGQI